MKKLYVEDYYGEDGFKAVANVLKDLINNYNEMIDKINELDNAMIELSKPIVTEIKTNVPILTKEISDQLRNITRSL